MFCQDNDPLSLANMDALIQSLATDGVLKTRFSEIRSEFNSFLDAFPSGTGFNIRGKRLTNRDIFDTFLYGEHGHSTKRATVQKWKGLMFYDDLRFTFDIVLLNFINAVAALKEVCEDILKTEGI